MTVCLADTEPATAGLLFILQNNVAFRINIVDPK